MNSAYASLLKTPFQTLADRQVDSAWEKWKTNNLGESWRHNLVAHLYYLADLVASLVILPFAALGVVFTSLQGLYTWNYEASLFAASRKLCLAKFNRLFISALGATFSPSGARYYKDEDISFFSLTVITGIIATYVFIKHPPNRFSIDSKGRLKFGWESYPRYY